VKATSYDVFLRAWYRAFDGATPSKLTTRADPTDDRLGRGGCRHRVNQIVGDHFQEALLLWIAATLEKETKFNTKRPSVFFTS
jgi:hypothetical protein